MEMVLAYAAFAAFLILVISITWTNFRGAPWVPTPMKLVHKMLKMAEVGVSLIPGMKGNGSSLEEFRREADKIGYPVMIKAAAGGGGKGMRIVHEPEHLSDAVEAAQRLAGPPVLAPVVGQLEVHRARGADIVAGPEVDLASEVERSGDERADALSPGHGRIPALRKSDSIIRAFDTPRNVESSIRGAGMRHASQDWGK